MLHGNTIHLLTSRHLETVIQKIELLVKVSEFEAVD